MAPLSSEAFLLPLPAVYRVLDLTPKDFRAAETDNFVEPLSGKIRFLVSDRLTGHYSKMVISALPTYDQFHANLAFRNILRHVSRAAAW